MFQEEYIRDLGSNYLMLYEEGKDYDEFQINMLMNNRIAGLLECEIRNIDGMERFLYEISSKQPISRIYEKTEIHYDDLISILRGIARAVDSAKEYLLDTGHFILQPEYMYINPETSRLFLCFYPQYYLEPDKAFHALAEYILNKINHKDEKVVVLAYDFYRKVNEDNFNIRSVLDIPLSVGEYPNLDRISTDKLPQRRQVSDPDIQRSEQTAVISPEEHEKEYGTEQRLEKVLFTIGVMILISIITILLWIQIYQPVFLVHSKKMQKIVVIIAGSMGGLVAFIGFVIANRMYTRNHQEKVIQSEEEIRQRYHAEEIMQKVITQEPVYCGETTLLTQSKVQKQPKLVRMKNGVLQEILVKTTPFVIGKMDRGVDAVIKEHSISRMHARISEQEGNYYLTDLNSTNGTFKNGIRLNANETTVIKADDEIRFADITFYFACC